MASTHINRDRVARILVDAITLGDRTAADRHKVSVKTVERHRARLKVDPVLSALVRELGKEAEHGWHFARARFLRRTLQKLDEMVQEAKPVHFEHVIEAMKAAGELDLATEALGVGSSARGQGPSAPEDPSGSPDAPEGEEPQP
jgi:hypothetical protein